MVIFGGRMFLRSLTRTIVMSVLVSLTLSLGVEVRADLLKDITGHFEGTITSHLGDVFEKKNVTTDINFEKKKTKVIGVVDAEKKTVFAFEILNLKKDKITIQSFGFIDPA